MASKQRHIRTLADPRPSPDPGLSEEESHREHAAALDATVFRPARANDEIVFELEAGRLRLRACRR